MRFYFLTLTFCHLSFVICHLWVPQVKYKNGKRKKNESFTWGSFDFEAEVYLLKHPSKHSNDYHTYDLKPNY